MSEKGKGEQVEMTFFEHLDSLRPHLLRGFTALFIVTIASFAFKGIIIDSILFGPQSPDFPTNRWLCELGRLTGIDMLCINKIDFNIVNTRMAGQFNLHMTVSIVTGIIITVPYLAWELWRFIKPALSYYEQHRSRMFVFYVSACFFTGLLFGYFVISPLTINFLTGYQASSAIVNMIDVSSYLSTVINISMACAAVFQLPVLVYFLAKMGIISSDFMRKYRKHAIVVMVIFAAIITPPDIFSQVLVSLPLIALYELSIKIAAGIEKKKRKEDLAFYGDLPENTNSSDNGHDKTPPPTSTPPATTPPAATPPQAELPNAEIEQKVDQSYIDYYSNENMED